VTSIRMDKVYRVGARKVRVRDIPMMVCESCGERFLDAKGAAYVERSLGVGRRARKPAA
jgi:YgiT-type zinc finger domain-containing protein